MNYSNECRSRVRWVSSREKVRRSMLDFRCWFISVVFCLPQIAFNMGDRFYYLPEVFVIKSVMNTGVQGAGFPYNKMGMRAEAGTLFPSSITFRVEMTNVVSSVTQNPKIPTARFQR